MRSQWQAVGRAREGHAGNDGRVGASGQVAREQEHADPGERRGRNHGQVQRNNRVAGEPLRGRGEDSDAEQVFGYATVSGYG